MVKPVAVPLGPGVGQTVDAEGDDHAVAIPTPVAQSEKIVDRLGRYQSRFGHLGYVELDEGEPVIAAQTANA
jgi:hypothetical protein